MSALELVSRLERARQIRPGSWTARCPSHPDRTPSLSIRETADGTVLLKCFSGCSAADIVLAVGLELHDLFPARAITGAAGPVPRPRFIPAEVFELARLKVAVVSVIASDMREQRKISERDYKALAEAVTTLERIAEGAYK